MVNRELYNQKLIENLHDGVYFVNSEYVIKFWNTAAERITGLSSAEVLETSCKDNLLQFTDAQDQHLDGAHNPLFVSMMHGKAEENDAYFTRRDGKKIHLFMRANPVLDSSGSVIGGIHLFTDLTGKPQESRLRELEKIAMLDHLTHLANRAYIEKEFHSRIQEKNRYQLSFGVIFIDIDFFKNINDTYGHDAGDMVLKRVAESFTKSARPYDFFGRWGGEEFVAIIRNVDKQTLIMVGERYRKLVQSLDIEIGGKKLEVTVSMGATMIEPADDMSSVIQRADKLMYVSKNEGRNRLTTDIEMS
ncbi:MAG: sensor domain-containing diguanylate cyclase [Candidatus Marinimicrobia bacterium]|nr:sensor domain-containing diguanylate cyclase [Candidatus Neomarinimicrobiota bacterium]